MPSSPRIADAACSLSPRPPPRLLVAALATARRERCRPAAGAARRIIATGASRTTTSSSSRRASRALLKWRIEAARAGLPKPPRAATPRVARRPRLPARQRRRRRGDGAGADLDRPRQHAGPGGRRQHPHRPDVLRARVAARLRRAEAPRAAGAGARRAAAHRRRRHLAQPLRPPRRGERARRSRRSPAGRRSSSCRSASRRWLADVGIDNARRARLVAERRASARSRSSSTPAQHWSGRIARPTAWRRSGAATRSSRPDFQVCSSPATPRYSKDFADIHARFAARHGAGRGFDLALIPIGAYEPRWFMKRPARRPGRGGADPPGPRRRALDRHPLGHVPAHRRAARRAAAARWRARRARPASATTPSA